MYMSVRAKATVIAFVSFLIAGSAGVLLSLMHGVSGWKVVAPVIVIAMFGYYGFAAVFAAIFRREDLVTGETLLDLLFALFFWT